ncbi:MAG: aspartate--ammonia ligase [Erysipelotrichaceae bacterium]|nr:aspartate--ammonia ligase [Erysipelotrichaceae bacterium]
MQEIIIPKNYQSKLGNYDTQKAIGLLKEIFSSNLSSLLHLRRVSAPLFVRTNSGLNDDLSGVERPVRFTLGCNDDEAEVVHSLAKWKRLALHNYDFYPGNGLYTDMNAIRRDETLDNLHSIYVDQWDWEKVITREQRNIEYLKEEVRGIVKALSLTNEQIKKIYPVLDFTINEDVFFITSQELEDLYPDLSPKQREDAIAKIHKTVFIIGIGDKLASGKPHDNRAPDYDDWQLNGDILLWYPLLDRAVEISSMGIRVDSDSLRSQLEKAGCLERLDLPFHQMLVNDRLPLTIGGGIGESRICMLLLEKAHIGEVQVSIWDEANIQSCKKAGIRLL